MKSYQKRRIIYSIGLFVALYVIFSLLIGTQWVFQVFLLLNNRTITLDGNRDGHADYWEHWKNGKLLQSEWDLDYDGKVDFINRFRDGEVWELVQDADYDGYFEYRERWVEDRYFVEIDKTGDGVFHEIKTGDGENTLEGPGGSSGGVLE